MHLYNAWLPPAVADAAQGEAVAFAGAVRVARDAFRPDDPDSAYTTLKWISVFDLGKDYLLVMQVGKTQILSRVLFPNSTTVMCEVGSQIHLLEDKDHVVERVFSVLKKYRNCFTDYDDPTAEGVFAPSTVQIWSSRVSSFLLFTVAIICRLLSM